LCAIQSECESRIASLSTFVPKCVAALWTQVLRLTQERVTATIAAAQHLHESGDSCISWTDIARGNKEPSHWLGVAKIGSDGYTRALYCAKRLSSYHQEPKSDVSNFCVSVMSAACAKADAFLLDMETYIMDETSIFSVDMFSLSKKQEVAVAFISECVRIAVSVHAESREYFAGIATARALNSTTLVSGMHNVVSRLVLDSVKDYEILLDGTRQRERQNFAIRRRKHQFASLLGTTEYMHNSTSATNAEAAQYWRHAFEQGVRARCMDPLNNADIIIDLELTVKLFVAGAKACEDTSRQIDLRLIRLAIQKALDALQVTDDDRKVRYLRLARDSYFDAHNATGSVADQHHVKALRYSALSEMN